MFLIVSIENIYFPFFLQHKTLAFFFKCVFFIKNEDDDDDDDDEDDDDDADDHDADGDVDADADADADADVDVDDVDDDDDDDDAVDADAANDDDVMMMVMMMMMPAREFSRVKFNAWGHELGHELGHSVKTLLLGVFTSSMSIKVRMVRENRRRSFHASFHP